jgi:AbrB family looped-hinge helix DNA binding protein
MGDGSRLTARQASFYDICIDAKRRQKMQTTISSKFQVVIPKPVREHLGLKPRQKMTVIEKDRMLIMIPEPTLDDLRGIAAGVDVSGYREKEDRSI